MDEDILYQRLVKLGDLMGDGCHLESDGKWIEKEYRDTARLLGLLPKKSVRRDSKSIDEFMKNRLEAAKCTCGEKLTQNRKGSFVGVCPVCGKRYKLGSRKRVEKMKKYYHCKNGVADLKKARDYLDRLIDYFESEGEHENHNS